MRLPVKPPRLTHERLLHALHYEPQTGIFTWKNQIGRRKKEVGTIAGFVVGHGYVGISFDGCPCKAHHLAWFYVYGAWPEQQLDHINGVRNDNRIENLRLATLSQNRANSKRNRNNTSGYKGVYFRTARGKWVAEFRKRRLGHFTDPESAHAAYVKHLQETYGDFARAE